MTAIYSDWLASLGARRADMPTQTRGLVLEHLVTYPGDVTSASLVGSVRAAPDSDISLANFTVSTPTFANGETTWTISLNETQVNNLPADESGNGVNYLLFDFLITLSGGNAQRLFGGLLPISGHITETS